MALAGWHWMIGRAEQLAQFPVPSLDATFLAGAMRALMAALILAALVPLAGGLLKRRLAAEKHLPAE